MKTHRFLMIGAHPDDADIRFGGTAVKLVRAGHTVKFLSLCNGNCGHFEQSGKALADRRYLETQASAKIAGLAEYQVWLDSNDCELFPTLENRKKLIRIIRDFKPDVVLTHRTCDYHADHRATAQLVQDAAYLTQVPMFCPETPIPDKSPVFGYVYDDFEDPRPFRPDAIVPIDDAMETKCRMLDCHVSQVYEWLAWELNEHFDPTTWTWQQKQEYLTKNWSKRNKKAADLHRDKLIALFGDAGRNIQYAEAFELSPYGSTVDCATPEAFQALFTF